ncbi:Hypothetical protein CAP_4876 [Chondromyces apiculatus DSM 436]|uniref:Uncharacterized protein n=1 Tax=Chondromyces apiculatus DSM 436 TaxID=1192034 RepID=A0A017T4S4_9BACT|nr:Hypothetical protein CAP_4876 [Chondromyces apiculatus DSM 436]
MELGHGGRTMRDPPWVVKESADPGATLQPLHAGGGLARRAVRGDVREVAGRALFFQGTSSCSSSGFSSVTSLVRRERALLGTRGRSAGARGAGQAALVHKAHFPAETRVHAAASEDPAGAPDGCGARRRRGRPSWQQTWMPRARSSGWGLHIVEAKHTLISCRHYEKRNSWGLCSWSLARSPCESRSGLRRPRQNNHSPPSSRRATPAPSWCAETPPRRTSTPP